MFDVLLAQLPPPTPTYIPTPSGTPYVLLPDWDMWTFAPQVVGTVNQMEPFFVNGARIAVFLFLLGVAIFLIYWNIKRFNDDS